MPDAASLGWLSVFYAQEGNLKSNAKGGRYSPSQLSISIVTIKISQHPFILKEAKY